MYGFNDFFATLSIGKKYRLNNIRTKLYGKPFEFDQDDL